VCFQLFHTKAASVDAAKDKWNVYICYSLILDCSFVDTFRQSRAPMKMNLQHFLVKKTCLCINKPNYPCLFILNMSYTLPTFAFCYSLQKMAFLQKITKNAHFSPVLCLPWTNLFPRPSVLNFSSTLGTVRNNIKILHGCSTVLQKLSHPNPSLQSNFRL
jgi:hypothetical protein